MRKLVLFLCFGLLALMAPEVANASPQEALAQEPLSKAEIFRLPEHLRADAKRLEARYELLLVAASQLNASDLKDVIALQVGSYRLSTRTNFKARYAAWAFERDLGSFRKLQSEIESDSRMVLVLPSVSLQRQCKGALKAP